MDYFLGIDPGESGGLGVVDHQGRYVLAARWDRKSPAANYHRLVALAPAVRQVYLEVIAAFPVAGLGHVVQTMPLYINYGIWQGWLMAVGLAWVPIHPRVWQSAVGLQGWQARAKEGRGGFTPLTLARQQFPAAPLEHKVDDGKAVGLLLAHLAWKDARLGLDRAAQVAEHHARIASKKRQARKARKAEKDLYESLAQVAIVQPGASHEPV